MPVSRYSRYHGLPQVEQGGVVSLALRPATPGETPGDSIAHVLIGGETFDLLAARYYGRADLWWRIADANPKRFPLDWRPGETVIIPPIRIATRVARR